MMNVGTDVLLITISAFICILFSFYFALKARQIDVKGHEKYILPALIFGLLGIVLLVIKLGMTRPSF